MPDCDLRWDGSAMLMRVHSSLQAELICAVRWTFTFFCVLIEGHCILNGHKNVGASMCVCCKCAYSGVFVFRPRSTTSSDCIVGAEPSEGSGP